MHWREDCGCIHLSVVMPSLIGLFWLWESWNTRCVFKISCWTLRAVFYTLTAHSRGNTSVNLIKLPAVTLLSHNWIAKEDSKKGCLGRMRENRVQHWRSGRWGSFVLLPVERGSGFEAAFVLGGGCHPAVTHRWERGATPVLSPALVLLMVKTAAAWSGCQASAMTNKAVWMADRQRDAPIYSLSFFWETEASWVETFYHLVSACEKSMEPAGLYYFSTVTMIALV